jgi:hypothetical protein
MSAGSDALEAAERAYEQEKQDRLDATGLLNKYRQKTGRTGAETDVDDIEMGLWYLATGRK